MRQLFFVFIAVFLYHGTALADKYIDTAAADNAGTGAIDSPWKDIEYALEGGRMTEGETLYITDADGVIENIFIDKVTAEQQVDTSFVDGAGAVTVKPLSPTEMIEIQIPANTKTGGGAAFFLVNHDDISFEGIKFTNPNSSLAAFFLINAANVAFSATDCWFDGNDTAQSLGLVYLGGVSGSSITMNRVAFTNINSPAVRKANGADGVIGTVNLRSVYIHGGSAYGEAQLVFGGETVLRAYNITMVQTTAGDYGILFNAGDDFDAVIKNVHYMALAANPDSSYAFRTYTGPDTWMSENLLSWDISYNVAEAPNDSGPLPRYAHRAFWQSVELIPFDYRNWVIDTGTINNRTIPAGSAACGRGDSSVLPDLALNFDGTTFVRGGVAWTGTADIGAFPNGSATPAVQPSILANNVIFFGDSIFENTATTNGIGVEFNSIPGSAQTALYYDTDAEGLNPGAQGGITIEQVGSLIDWCGINTPTEYGVLSIGANNLDANGVTSPSSLDNADLAVYIVEMMKKIEFWGMEPVWVGITPLKGPVTVNSEAVNALVLAECVVNGWKCVNNYDYLSVNASWATDYYADIVNDVHPNDEGKELLAYVAYGAINGWFLAPYDFNGTGPHMVHPRQNGSLKANGKVYGRMQ